MRSNKNELIVYRGEGFSIDFSVVNPDGSPYIVSSKLNGANLLITITDSKHHRNSNFRRRYFLPVPPENMFSITNVVRLEDVTDINGNQLYHDWPELSSDDVYLSGYYKGKLVEFTYGDVVFSLNTASGIEYRYASRENEPTWVDYWFRFVQTFLPDDTENWPTQKLYYSIFLKDKNGSYNVPLVGSATIDVLSDL